MSHKRWPATLGAALLAASLLALPAAAQTERELIYSQTLTEPAIRQVQERLREIGAYDGVVDGVWGPQSQQALERFQQRHGLQVTGQLNPATLTTLGLSPARLLTEGGGTARAGTDATAVATEALSRDAVRNIQGRLRMLGFYRGDVDGLWGPTTQQAIARFQQSRALQPTGHLNPATIQALGLDPNNLEASAR